MQIEQEGFNTNAKLGTGYNEVVKGSTDLLAEFLDPCVSQERFKPVYLLYAGTVRGVTVACVSVADVSFHARTDAGTSVS